MEKNKKNDPNQLVLEMYKVAKLLNGSSSTRNCSEKFKINNSLLLCIPNCPHSNFKGELRIGFFYFVLAEN